MTEEILNVLDFSATQQQADPFATTREHVFGPQRLSEVARPNWAEIRDRTNQPPLSDRPTHLPATTSEPSAAAVLESVLAMKHLLGIELAVSTPQPLLTLLDPWRLARLEQQRQNQWDSLCQSFQREYDRGGSGTLEWMLLRVQKEIGQERFRATPFLSRNDGGAIIRIHLGEQKGNIELRSRPRQ